MVLINAGPFGHDQSENGCCRHLKLIILMFVYGCCAPLFWVPSPGSHFRVAIGYHKGALHGSGTISSSAIGVPLICTTEAITGARATLLPGSGGSCAALLRFRLRFAVSVLLLRFRPLFSDLISLSHVHGLA